MNEALPLIWAGLAGVLLGGIFFGGLWWTARQGLASPHPARWFFISLLLRTGITLAGFYYVSGDAWQRLILCLLGFIIARLLVTWLTRLKPQLPQAACHAPKP